MISHDHTLSHHHETSSTDVFGFWLYILTDCILFGSIFATFVVMHQAHAYGPSLKSVIELPYVFWETMTLLASNLTFGFAMMALYRHHSTRVQIWLLLTFLLGAMFVGMEISEFIHLCHIGFTPQVSGLASAFFSLVGTHGLHVTFGLLWILIMILQIHCFKTNEAIERKMTMLGIFWNFLDIVWIFVFTTVYLTGAMS